MFCKACVLVILLFLNVALFSQSDKDAWADSLKLRLSLVKEGEEKLLILTQLARIYVESRSVQSDSGYKYAKAAYGLSVVTKDKVNGCIAAELYAKVLLQMSKASEGLHYYRITKQLAEETNNKRITAIATRNIGQALWYRGYFKESIDTILQSIVLLNQLGDKFGVADATVAISSIYGNMGYYEKAFEFAQHALRLSTESDDRGNIVLSLIQIGYLYNNTGDHITCLEYYRKAYAYKPRPTSWPYRYLFICMGDLYAGRQQYDSAWHFYQLSLSGNAKSKASKLRFGNYFLSIKKYDSAALYFSELYDELKDGGEGHLSVYAGLGLAEVHSHYHEYQKALSYANDALQIGTERNAAVIIRDACKILSSIHDSIEQPGKAFYYYKQYVQMKDMVITDQFKGRLYEFRRIADDEKRQTQILIAEQKLKKNQLLRNFLIAGILIVALLSLVIFWNISLKRKNENLKNKSLQAEWQRTAADLEMQALRARMNPHFIFNCLSSINGFILRNEADKASDYLTRFSRLMRLVLVNSQKPWISLEEEVEMLRLYIEMEKLRFKNAFDYSINYPEGFDLAGIRVPPLLLQPFCENAIWHGLMHKDGYGHLDIRFEMPGDVLCCTITDDGIGRQRSSALKANTEQSHKSLGLRLSTARLALFNEDNSVQGSYEVQDLKNEKGEVNGTKVILKIKNKTTETDIKKDA